MSTISRFALVPYTDREMFELVADIPSYPKFLPWCADARIVATEEDAVIATVTIAYSGVQKTFTTRNRLQKNKMMEIRLLEGPFRYLHGYWRFSALDKDACRISLDLEFEVANKLVGIVLTPVFTNIANQLVDGFHRRAVALYGART